MFSDSAYGFMVWDSMVRGAAFNHATMPDFADIARDRSLFMTVWSPGQYLFAGALERLGLGLGTGMTVVTTLFTVLGLVGWYRLYRAWNFPVLSAAVALAITAGSRHFALPFGIYNGGEVLLFGGMPWFLLLLKRWQGLSAAQAIGLLAAIAALAFLKLSGILFAFSALAAVVICDLWPPRQARWRRPVVAALLVVVFGAAFYVFWQSRGWTALDAKFGTNWPILVPSFLEGWAASVSAMFSLGDMAARLLQRPGQQILKSLDLLYLAGSVPALLLLRWSARRLKASHGDYVRFAATAALIYIAGLAVIYGAGGELKMEDRFFRPVGLLMLVGVVHAVLSARNAIRWPLGALAAASMAYGVVSYGVRLDHNRHMPLGARGFHHGNLSADGLALIRKQEIAPGTVVWVMAPEIALEVPQARLLVNAEVERALQVRTYRGRVDRLLVFVDDKMMRDGRAEIVLRSFVDYDRTKWVAAKQGDTTVFSQ
ncbi:MAG: hypothetical protein JSR24_07650 [Proteobacteria bacterium]|nr:hypothetical protein [Pseudomonadota bacterium]